jgi:hypothetical protein
MFGHIKVNEASGFNLECHKYIKDTKACRDRNKEIAGYSLVRMIPDKGGPALAASALPARRSFDVFADRSRREPNLELQRELIGDSLFSHVGFSLAIRRIKAITSRESEGLPTGLDFQRQNILKAARCQPIKVAGLTITSAFRQSK